MDAGRREVRIMAGIIRVTWNSKNCYERLGAILAKSYVYVPRAVEIAGKNVLNKSKLDAPIKTGALRRSGTINSMGNEVNIRFSANNFRTGFDYAEIQHDNTNYNHPRGGKARYLSDNMEDAEQMMVRQAELVLREIFY